MRHLNPQINCHSHFVWGFTWLLTCLLPLSYKRTLRLPMPVTLSQEGGGMSKQLSTHPTILTGPRWHPPKPACPPWQKIRHCWNELADCLKQERTSGGIIKEATPMQPLKAVAMASCCSNSSQLWHLGAWWWHTQGLILSGDRSKPLLSLERAPSLQFSTCWPDTQHVCLPPKINSCWSLFFRVLIVVHFYLPPQWRDKTLAVQL